jgi:hypothetical protein
MKKIYILIFISLFVYAIQAQELTNPGFESWENFGSYEEPVGWHTPNPFTSLIGAITVTKSDDAAAGMYSAKLESILIEFGPLKYNVPGLVTYADFDVDFVSGDFTFGGGLYMPFPVQSLSGKYKYMSVEDDTASVIIYSYAHPEGEPMDTIGIGYGFKGAAAEWTDFMVPMFPLNDHTPDTFNVLLMSTNTFNIDSVTPGSILYVDELSIETSVGIFNLTGRQTEISVYPNPTTNYITFESAENGTNRVLRIFDINGRELKNMEFNTLKVNVDVSSFTKGHYSYVLQEDNELLNSGSFIKK